MLLALHKPSKMEELLGNEELGRQIEMLVESGHIPNMCIVGPHGVGKKTLVQLFVKRCYPEKRARDERVMAIDGPKDRGADLEEKIVSFIMQRVTPGLPKLVVIYNPENMTPNNQAALRGLIERKQENVRFIMVVNKLGDLMEAIQSRCVVFEMVKPAIDEHVGMLTRIRDGGSESARDAEDVEQIEWIAENNSVRGSIIALEMYSHGLKIDREIEKKVEKWATTESIAEALGEARGLLEAFRSSEIMRELTKFLAKTRQHTLLGKVIRISEKTSRLELYDLYEVTFILHGKVDVEEY